MNTVYRLINEWYVMAHDIHPKGKIDTQLHYHHSYELFIMVNGSSTMLLDDKLVQVGKNDIVLIKPDNLHKNNGGTQHERYAVHFTENYLKKYFTDSVINKLTEQFENNKVSLKPKAFAAILDLLRKMEKGSEFTYIHIAELISIICDPHNVLKKENIKSTGIADRVLEYINSNYGSIAGLEEIAAQVHVSKQYMCTLFKKEINVTVSEYLNSVRINNACELLRENKSSITETAMLCGYNSPMYFSKSFKKIVGMTPNEYRSHSRK